MSVRRCGWAGDDPLMLAYHDGEWGRPSHDERHLFEMLVLEGAQAGLSWRTILHKRENYRRAFAGFDVHRVSRFGERDVRRLMADAGIVRNEQKIRSAIENARASLALGSLDELVWSFVGGKAKVNRPNGPRDVPARTAESDALSKALKKRGFNFVGSTIMYAFMQACGLVDDHMRGCFRARR